MTNGKVRLGKIDLGSSQTDLPNLPSLYVIRLGFNGNNTFQYKNKRLLCLDAIDSNGRTPLDEAKMAGISEGALCYIQSLETKDHDSFT